MANILDYIDWRGDLSFDESPFNEIDALILMQITYLNFDGILENENFRTELTIRELSEVFKKSPDFEARSDVGALINKNTIEVLLKAAESVRFKDILATGFVNIIDLEKEEQFAALTFRFLPKKIFVVFRGTDDTIVGFKEDFNLAIMDEVPAQKDAVDYLERAAKELKGDIYVGGHSKGGNLAVYASAMCRPDVKKRVESIFNMDGPGFKKVRIQSQEFYETIPKIHSFYPHFSIVGMIFDRAGKYSVVQSDQTGLLQHDALSWHVKGPHFETCDEFDKTSDFLTGTLNKWLFELTHEQQSQFVETLYKVIKSTDAKTNSEIKTNAVKNSLTIIKAWKETEPEIRKNVEKTVRQLFKVAHKELPPLTFLFSGGTENQEKGKNDAFQSGTSDSV